MIYIYMFEDTSSYCKSVVAMKGMVEANTFIETHPDPLHFFISTKEIPIGSAVVRNGELVEEEPVKTTEVLAQEAKTKRFFLLKSTDWTDLASSPSIIGASKYREWKDYRQALRDITQQEGFPSNIEWPIPPEEINQG